MLHGLRRWLAGAGAATACVTLVLGQADLASAVGVSGGRPGSVYVPGSQPLSPGMHGPAVRALQQRLSFLHYYPGRINGRFDPMTLEAVWAFKEVQGLGTRTRPDEVHWKMQRALVHPRAPKVITRGGGASRIEINKAIQVLVLYRHNKVRLITHVSTGGNCLPGQGCGWNTPDGSYRAIGFIKGWIHVPLGLMFNPVFFIGTIFAIHGDTDAAVPLRPASHGCVRIPKQVATFFYRLIRISPADGTPIYIGGPDA